MDIAERIKKYQAIEDYRGRPLIAYATSTRRNVRAMMAGDAVRWFIDQIDAISDGESVDILIHSTGGDALAAWKLMSTLRGRFSDVAVLVPYMAFSAATIFCLGADEIVMHPHASLGPIDPQISLLNKDGTRRQFSFEDVGAFLRFLADEIRITEQAQVSPVVEKLLSVVDPLILGSAKRASELSTDVGERLLQTHMTEPEEASRTRDIAENLNKSFFAHGDAVSRLRAKELDLKVADSDRKLEALIWEAYVALEEHMELEKPFLPMEHFIANGGAPAVAAVPPVPIPPNAPAQVVKQIWTTVIQQAVQAAGGQGIEVPYSLINALIESCRTSAEFRTNGVLTATRQPDGEIKLLASERGASWTRVEFTDGEEED